MAGERSFSIPIQITITGDAGYTAALARIEQILTNPDIMGHVVKQAVAETLLTAYRERFLTALPSMLHMEKLAANSKVVTFDHQIKQDLLEASKALTAAQLSGDHGVQQLAEAHATRAANTAVKSLRRTIASPLSTGLFRKLAMQVLDAIANASRLTVETTGEGGVFVGIGARDDLEQIETPSATPMLTGSPTSSDHNILWRHLEFGTGAYATQPRSPGGWTYGPTKGFGLQLKGSKAGHFLFTNAGGMAHEQDAPLLARHFGELLMRALLG